MICRLIAIGPKNFFSVGNMLETFVVLANFVLIIVFFDSAGIMNRNEHRAIILVQLLRFLNIAMRVAYLHILVNTLIKMLWDFGRVLGVILAFYYLFAFVGIEAFGGRLYEGSSLLKGSIYDVFLSRSILPSKFCFLTIYFPVCKLLLLQL